MRLHHVSWLGLLLAVACSPSPDPDAPSGPATEDPGADTDAPRVSGDGEDADTGTTTDTGDADDGGCLIADDGSSSGPGRYTVSSMELAPGNSGATVHYPTGIADHPCMFPVIGWGNGTSSTGGDAYPEYFERLASHGFVVAVAHTNFAANGPVILDTVAQVLADSDDPESVFFGRLRAEYGVMGKSQGAIAAARDVNTDPDAVAAVLVAGSVGTVTKPALFATGDEDFLRRGTLNGYEGATAEAVYAEAAGGVDHLALDDHVGVARLATSFMRCHLQDDASACAYVACIDCQVEDWGDYRVR